MTDTKDVILTTSHYAYLPTTVYEIAMPKDNWSKENNRAKYGPTRPTKPKKASLAKLKKKPSRTAAARKALKSAGRELRKPNGKL